MSANPKINPAKYSALVAAARPAIIRTKQEHKRILDAVWELMSIGEENRTPEEDSLFDLLAKLVEDYENQIEPEPTVSPARMLAHLMEAQDLRQIDLVPIIGSRGRVSEILNGKRGISKTQAKALGEFFKVDPGVFI